MIRHFATPHSHYGNRDPEATPRTRIDPDELAAALAEFNRGTRRAVVANRDREQREDVLDRLARARAKQRS